MNSERLFKNIHLKMPGTSLYTRYYQYSDGLPVNDLKQQLAPGWSAVNIAIVVVLFIIDLWPFALLMLAYIIWGHKAGLDLSRPATFGTFAKRLGIAWRAAIQTFKNNG